MDRLTARSQKVSSGDDASWKRWRTHWLRKQWRTDWLRGFLPLAHNKRWARMHRISRRNVTDLLGALRRPDNRCPCSFGSVRTQRNLRKTGKTTSNG